MIYELIQLNVTKKFHTQHHLLYSDFSVIFLKLYRFIAANDVIILNVPQQAKMLSYYAKPL